MKPLLIVRMGACLLPERGEFADLIREGAAVSANRIRVVDVVAGEPLPSPTDAAGVIVTGSAAMVTAREPWSERTGAWLLAMLEANVPFLGICYGHQLLADVLGGHVGVNPRGREMGTIDVDVTEAARGDPLFATLPPRLRVQATHLESVLDLPPGARLLAGNAADPHQAFAVGARAWCVQFHPEFDAEVMRGYIAARAEMVRAEGLDPDAMHAAAEDSPHGHQLLRRFAVLCGAA